MWTNVAISASTPVQRTLSRGHAANPSSHRLHLTMGQWRRIKASIGHVKNINTKMYAEVRILFACSRATLYCLWGVSRTLLGLLYMMRMTHFT
jgi:hypothetical protein